VRELVSGNLTPDFFCLGCEYPGVEREKGLPRIRDLLFSAIAIVLLCVQGVSGFSVSSINVDPSGNLTDGAPVTVTCEIPRTGILLYDQLVLATDLDNPRWDPVVIVRNQETPVTPASANGNTLILNGVVFNYPPPVPVKIHVVVKGMVPDNHTASQRLLIIRQLDAEGAEYAYPSGYLLSMPGSPPLAIPETDTIPATPTETRVPKDTTENILTPVPENSSIITTAPALRTTVSLPTPLPGRTPAAAAPVEPLVAVGAAGIAMLLVRNSAIL
jgi:hypothetical protein